MKAKRLDEIRTFLDSETFRGWWESLARARAELASAAWRHEESLAEALLAGFRAELTQKNAIDTLYASSESEDEGARCLAEASAVENRSMEALASYEEQRFRTSDAWIRLGAADKHLEELRDRLAALQGRADGKNDLHRVEGELQKAQREQRAAHETYERETARKGQLWGEVEKLWAEAMELGLLCSEKETRAARIKRDAERLFAEAEAHKQRLEELRQEGQALSQERERLGGYLEELFAHARQNFDCVLGNDFLYWGARENNKLAWCVSLIANEASYNMELVPLGVYSVSAKDGVRRLDPVPPSGAEAPDEDQRVDAYFNAGPKGRAGSGGE